jgi:SOS-response transcriptional repressor LexA
MLAEKGTIENIKGFFVKARGKLMTGNVKGQRIKRGDLFFVEPDEPIQNGCFALFNASKGTTVARVWINDDTVILDPINNEVEPEILKKEELSRLNLCKITAVAINL